jgi:hypothetical protein
LYANPAAVGVLPIAEPAVFESHPGLSVQNKRLKKVEGPGEIMTSDSSATSERIVSEIINISVECDVTGQASSRLDM